MVKRFDRIVSLVGEYFPYFSKISQRGLERVEFVELNQLQVVLSVEIDKETESIIIRLHRLAPGISPSAYGFSRINAAQGVDNLTVLISTLTIHRQDEYVQDLFLVSVSDNSGIHASNGIAEKLCYSKAELAAVIESQYDNTFA